MQCGRLGLLLAGFWCAGIVASAETPDAWNKVFNRPEELSASRDPVVCVLHIQHADVIRKQITEKPADQFSGVRFRQRAAELSGLPCLMLHFTEIRGEDLERPNVKAILISGRSKSTGPEQDRKFYSLIQNTKIPMIGFCGGMQLIGQAYGAKVGPMRKLHEGEKDPAPSYHPGQFKEWGFLPVDIARRDPLFASLPDTMIMREMHAFHMLQAPAAFDVLARTAECPVEAIKHRERILYGTQFHPEAYDDQHPHGRVLIENFFRVAGLASHKPQ